MKQIIVNVVFSADGTVNRKATDAEYETLCNRVEARVNEDQETLAVEVTAFFLQRPGLKTIPNPVLLRQLWGERLESGVYKGKSDSEKGEAYDRLEEILPEYIKANPKMFHVGRKTGIAVRYVPGEVARDDAGEALIDDDGNETQLYRHNAEEWAKMTEKREAAATSTANGAATHASA